MVSESRKARAAGADLSEDVDANVGAENIAQQRGGGNGAWLAEIQSIVRKARADAHAVGYRKPGANKWAYKPAPGAPSEAALLAHLNGGPPLGLYPISAGSDVTSFAVFDLDDHEGTVDWGEMCDAALAIATAARRYGLQAWPVRSGGGRGIHLWFFWDKPQPARDVREALATILAEEGFEDGTGGIAKSQIEIFPKQDFVGNGPSDFGNLIALPFSRESVPLDAAMMPCDAPKLWLTSQPVAAAAPPHFEEPPKGKKGEIDLDEVKEALGFLASDVYPLWAKIGLVLKGALAERGFDLWRDWSKKSQKKYSPGQTERKWSQLRPNGSLTIGTLYWHAKQAGWAGPKPAKTTAATVVADILASIELWLDERGLAYATVPVGDHLENMSVAGSEFRHWIGQEFYKRKHTIASREVLKQAVEHAEGQARFVSTQRFKSWVRTAWVNGKIYLDLGDPDWRAIEIDAEGWRVVPAAPIRFRRSATTQALPMPERGGNSSSLRRFFSVDDDDFRLLVGVMVSYYRPALPQPISYFAGLKGSAKTTALKYVVRLLDPRTVEAGAPAKSIDDLIVAAQMRLLVTGDNLSHISAEMADAYCRLSTGGGLERRGLYTNEDVHAINVLRPVVLAGINPGTNRTDFMDRTVLITLLPLDESVREEVEVLDAEFEAARPRLLGLLLNGVSVALARLEETRVRLKGQLPRMADFATFAEAAAPAFGWADGEFLASYNVKIDDQIREAAETNQFVIAIRDYLAAHGGAYKGAAQKIFKEMDFWLRGKDQLYGDVAWWPRSAVWFGRWLRNETDTLAALGVTYRLLAPKGGSSVHELVYLNPDPEPAPADLAREDAILF